MSQIRLLTSLFLLASLLPLLLHAQDRLESCDGFSEMKPADDQWFAQHVSGEPVWWVEWQVHSNDYVITVSREHDAVWITMIDRFRPYFDPDLLPPEDREAAIERAPKPRTNVYKEPISEALAQDLSLAWSEWLSEPPGKSSLYKDGVTYLFRKINQCGMAWSPDPGTVNDMRVTLVRMLSRLAQGTQSYRPVNEEQRIEDWLRRIRFGP